MILTSVTQKWHSVTSSNLFSGQPLWFSLQSIMLRNGKFWKAKPSFWFDQSDIRQQLEIVKSNSVST